MSFSRPFLKVVEQSAVDEGSRRYLVHCTPTGTAAIAVAELLSKPCRHNPVMDILLGRFRGCLGTSRNWLLPMLSLRPELSSDVPIVATASTAQEQSAIVFEMLSALQLRAADEAWSLAVTGVPANDVGLIGALRRLGYLQTEGRPLAELHLQWDSWESYLKQARRCSKNAAATVRQETNRARREGVTFAEWHPGQIPEATLYRLLDDHERRQNGRGFRFRAGFLSTLKQALGDSVRVLLALGGEEQVQGVTVLAFSDRRGYVPFLGLVEKAERTGSAYFNLIYYQPMQRALELGLESLAYGNAAYAAKIRRGCTVAATGLFLRPRHALIRAVSGGPLALHRRVLQQKYAPFLKASAFSGLPGRRTS